MEVAKEYSVKLYIPLVLGLVGERCENELQFSTLLSGFVYCSERNKQLRDYFICTAGAKAIH